MRKVVSGGVNIVDENQVSFFGSSKPAFEVSKTIQVNRVKVYDGSEELVSMAQIKGLTSGSFKRLLATSSDILDHIDSTDQRFAKQLEFWTKRNSDHFYIA